MKKLKKLCLNLILLCISCMVALLLCEAALRLILNPVDYLSPTLIKDVVLGIKLPPRGGGHDDWGFRNRKVPVTAEIIALGDSHTYGNCAKMGESWPAMLEKITGKSVYNMGMGGYGPNQYFYLLTNRALALKPKLVICGLYFGDDFDNAFRMTYGSEYWSSLRSQQISDVNGDIWEPIQALTRQKQLRNWLSRNSIGYRLIVHGLFSSVKGKWQIHDAARSSDSGVTLRIPKTGINEAFLPKNILRGIDQEAQSVTEGTRITFKLLKEMNDICRSNQITFIVAAIPTKETVFANFLDHNPTLKLSNTLDRLLANEVLARDKLFAFLEADRIPRIDLLPGLRDAIPLRHLYFESAFDMHPNKNGYRVIAEQISRSITNRYAYQNN